MTKVTVRPDSHFQTYLHQSAQRNPMLWKFMFREEDGSFIDQAPWMKCKDYFNDCVSYFKNHKPFKVYGFNNDGMKKNQEGFWVLVCNITKKDVFFHNLEIINQKLSEDLKCQMVWINLPELEAVCQPVLLCFPNEVMDTTYYVSLLTFAIRMSNYEKAFKNWEDIFYDKNGIMYVKESSMIPDSLVHCKAGFKLPKGIEKFWWWAGKNYNSEKTPDQIGDVIHNNGVSNWIYMKEVEKL